MLPAIEQLLVIQDRDRKIRMLKAEQKRVPLERQALEARQAGATKTLEEARLKAKQIEVQRKDHENQVQAKRDQIAKFQTQKFQTRKNEEFAALSHEIERYEKDIALIEDSELEIMEAADKQKAVIAEAEKEASTAKAQVQKQLADLDTKLAAIGEQLAKLDAERTTFAADFDEDLLDTYQRLFITKNDQAIVGLEHGVCTGCHMKVTPTTNAKTRAGKEIAQCENCARILYWVD